MVILPETKVYAYVLYLVGSGLHFTNLLLSLVWCHDRQIHMTFGSSALISHLDQSMLLQALHFYHLLPLVPMRILLGTDLGEEFFPLSLILLLEYKCFFEQVLNSYLFHVFVGGLTI